VLFLHEVSHCTYGSRSSPVITLLRPVKKWAPSVNRRVGSSGMAPVNIFWAAPRHPPSLRNMSNIPDAAAARLLGPCCQSSVVAIMCQLPSMLLTRPAMPLTRMPCPPFCGKISNTPDTTTVRPTAFWLLKSRVKYILVSFIMHMF